MKPMMPQCAVTTPVRTDATTIGIAVTIADEFDMPIKFMGVGESVEDIEEFDAAEFAGGIINE